MSQGQSEREMVASWRAKRMPWQDVAKCLGRSVDSVRRDYEPAQALPPPVDDRDKTQAFEDLMFAIFERVRREEQLEVTAFR